MLALDDPALGDLRDPRVRIIIDLLTETVYGEATVAAALRSAGLSPGEYELSRARLTWTSAVPDAAQQGALGALVHGIAAANRAFGTELERRIAALVTPTAPPSWYQHDDPYACAFVGLRSARALIDRVGLREGLRDLAEDQYRILIVNGDPRSGKSHTWVLVDHLRNTGKLVGTNKFARVTTHTWTGPVSGEDVARSLAAKLALNIDLTPSQELADTRVRKFLDLLVGHYPSGDGVTRWIMLDGLDRPGVQDSARDLAKNLIQLVEDSELQNTRLIITGMDPLGLQLGHAARVEEIPPITHALVSSFLRDVATHIGCTVADGELTAYAGEILGPDPEQRDLGEIEQAAFRLVQARWVAEVGPIA